MKDFQFLKRVPLRVYFLIIPLFLFSVFCLLFLGDFFLKFWVDANQVHTEPFSVTSEAKIPVIKTSFVPDISATGAIIMDADSKVVLYSKNPDLRFSTASTTKIMTALIGLDYFKPQDILTIQEASVEGSVLGLRLNEQMSFENLMYAMMLPSANDAAVAIADNYPGGQTGFLVKMNEKAKLFKLYNAHYSDPAGLEDSGDYTTPFDLARLASFAIQNNTFKQVVNTKQKIIYDASGTNVYSLKNLNELLGIDGVNGIKTGFTEEAGEVLVTSKDEKGKTIIIVVMGSANRFEDTLKLLDLVTNNITYLSIHP